ncbi:hypothetical protein Y032_0157g3172 [Ancylostoma ceylanicum]|uniref:BPTI/Kunitz inhibitor domain-containing protein n=1 Tax=Ancylostoma ceylanicum TaxID=53326 RepID=A0A016SYT5_9BILA|nr:hypothetical protein Y032_0157g3172 [Ancylostoma ceylanicum]
MKILLLLLIFIAIAICGPRRYVVKRSAEQLTNLSPRCRAPTYMPGLQCAAYFIRYTFNPQTADCEEFIYGGCNPSPNNFRTIEECRATCVIW